ncbi:hypothetical protein SMGD1_2528 [Sulfurimonas gotlandica GD1]|uniref:Uncharacterized protein n=1 Tax=Sulfurimonas gotlandica (strain DSM 19862 / JCM 16533 / GD1) TaxID=929558 RepID=B6BNH8_SULGG|nr:hypothetical protein [Sulfurimonas gotlandica]EDZ61421.1 hypothetical protein CBGD1_2488 [Sulfurimonas gotlandica GD1]EHP31050.1 hypothetical protein SMGD1_2528 [Sulfurimonas gotlandica GD1]
MSFKIITESPAWKTFFSSVLPIITGILSGIFVIEITIDGVIAWSSFFKATSFYVLVFVAICMYFYNKAIYLFENEISKFSDDEYCTAYIRSKCLPEAAEKYKTLIRNGNGGELKQAMDEMKKVLK